MADLRMKLTFKLLSDRIFIRFRRRRMKTFFSWMGASPAIRLLDIGGTVQTWSVESPIHESFAITLLNNRFYEPPADRRFTSVTGSATNLPFTDRSFDIAFSNSVIEHMGTWEQQQKFASEARRVALNLWIQTPARSFPIEPHLLAPWIQYLPRRIQHRIVQWTPRAILTPGVVHEIVDEVRLLTYREFRELFPDCKILRERVLGMTKSYIAVRECAKTP
jgi:hypothetical protein